MSNLEEAGKQVAEAVRHFRECAAKLTLKENLDECDKKLEDMRKAVEK